MTQQFPYNLNLVMIVMSLVIYHGVMVAVVVAMVVVLETVVVVVLEENPLWVIEMMVKDPVLEEGLVPKW